MTTQPPSHEEVQQLQSRIADTAMLTSLPEWLRKELTATAAMLESLLADNVRLSKREEYLDSKCDELLRERDRLALLVDQLRARIGELEAQVERVHNNYANMSLTSDTTKGERIAALEKDAAKWREFIDGVPLKYCAGIWNKQTYVMTPSVEFAERIDAALNPQCSGTATGREGQ